MILRKSWTDQNVIIISMMIKISKLSRSKLQRLHFVRGNNSDCCGHSLFENSFMLPKILTITIFKTLNYVDIFHVEPTTLAPGTSLNLSLRFTLSKIIKIIIITGICAVRIILHLLKSVILKKISRKVENCHFLATAEPHLSLPN